MEDQTDNNLSVTSVTSVIGDDENSPASKVEADDTEEKRNGTRNTARDRWGRLKSTMAATSNMVAKKKNGLDRGDSFLRKFSTRNQAEESIILENEDDKIQIDRSYSKHRTCSSYVIHPSGGLMFYWLGVVTLSVLYNLWTCIAREAFREIQDGYMEVWFSLDAFSDFIYACDIVVQFRTGYLQQGLMVYDTKKLCINYMKSKCFITDLLCLLPLDFLQFYTGIHAMLRFPRFLKIYRTVRFMHMYESRTAYPNLLRVLSLSHILFLGSHWFAAFYYLISEAEGFEGGWSYPEPKGMYASVTRKYLASLYWSTLTLTTIGDLPPPDTNWQYVFVIVSYLIGVFIFATIVGQVGNVITNRNASRQEFERLLDGAKFYMQMHNVPPDLQKRVQRWYDYVWTRGRLNCNDINSLGLLPDKLKTELALHVNLGTLRKVTIFQKCRPEFLHDLMLKMRAYIFTPGDLICRRGEVAREMFIIADGVVEILGENSTVLTQMSTGDFFGEIGILNLDGGINRRTADVRSVGYSELFVLSREDVLAALKDHPDAEEILHLYARRRLAILISQRTSEDGRNMPSTSRSISGESDGMSDSGSGSPDIQVFIGRDVSSHVSNIHLSSANDHNLDKSRNSSSLQIIREYGQRRLRETEEHRKMVRSAPCSPDPSSAWKGSKAQNKHSQNTEHSNLLHLPQVKYLQNLSQMSPKLRKVFHLRQKRSKLKGQGKAMSEDICSQEKDGSCKREASAAERRRSFQLDHGKTYPIASLDVIQERDHSDVSDCDQSDKENRDTGNFNLAKAVLNLLRSQKQAEYMAVHADESESEKVSTKTDDNTPVREQAPEYTEKIRQNVLQETSRRRYDSLNLKENGSDDQDTKKRCVRKHHSVDSQDRNTAALPLPKIVLTEENKLLSSTSSSESDSDTDKEKKTKLTSATLPVRPGSRDSVGRKSSPCVLNLPSMFSDRMSRRISLPPPLDLPIEVPKFSNFHGLTRNSSDVTHKLDRFKDTMERRMDELENSYKETVAKLEETTKMQERFMKTIIKKLTPGKEKQKEKADEHTTTDKDGNAVTTNKTSEEILNKSFTNIVTSTKDVIKTTPHQIKSDSKPNEKVNQNKKTSDLYSSGSSTEEQGSNSYAKNPSIGNIMQSSIDSSRQSSVENLQCTINGVRKPETFQMFEEKWPPSSNTDKMQSSINFDYHFDDTRVTHL